MLDIVDAERWGQGRTDPVGIFPQRFRLCRAQAILNFVQGWANVQVTLVDERRVQLRPTWGFGGIDIVYIPATEDDREKLTVLLKRGD